MIILISFRNYNILDVFSHLLGSYSYIDPKYKVRTVEYTADKTGFHPALINFEDTLAQPVDSEAVRLAKEKHLHLYERIAEANAHNIPLNLPRVIAYNVIIDNPNRGSDFYVWRQLQSHDSPLSLSLSLIYLIFIFLT